MNTKTKQDLITLFRALLIIIGFASGWIVGGILMDEANNNPLVPDVSATIAKPELVFRTIDTECIGIPEVTKGRIWLCDNGHIEYDHTNVKFPSLNDSEESEEESNE